MKREKLTFGAKINWTFAALAAVLALTVWFGFHIAGSLSDSLENATRKTTRRIELAGALNTAKSDMAVGQLAVVAVHLRQGCPKALLRSSSSAGPLESFRKALADFKPLIATEEGRQLVSHLEGTLALWLPAYSEMEQLADAGKPDEAARVLKDKVKPQWLALAADCTRLIEIQQQTDRRRAAVGER